MEDGKPLLLIVLLLLSAFFSGSETALFSLSRVYLKKLEKDGSSGAKRVLTLLKRPKHLLISLLLGNTFVNIGFSSLCTLIALDWAALHPQYPVTLIITIQVIVSTLLVVFFGEITPKLVALATADKTSLLVSLPMQVFLFLTYPLVIFFVGLSRLISRKQSLDKHLGQKFTTEEFHRLIQSESSKHSLEEHEKKMLVGLFRFRDTEISEIYVPRVKVTAIEVSQSLEELRELIVQSGYSRIPVYKETIDDIIGIIYVKDLLLYADRGEIKDFMRPVWFVTENMKIQALLNQFKSKKLQVAVVVDEYGGTSGIISLEDILEEIVGEIHDEYDLEESPELVKLDEYNYILAGTYNVRLFNHEFGTELDTDEYDNIAQFLLEVFNHVPAVDETYDLSETMILKVLDSDEKSIKSVQLTIVPETE
ncbi:MAG TPA: hemolysin family protein [Candidatus Cloacimonadota bacterium]|nr:hemolysin family protein [Candidatus Cloacimonadota bacterium]